MFFRNQRFFESASVPWPYLFGRWAPPTRATKALAVAGLAVLLLSLLFNRNIYYLSCLYVFLIFVVSVVPSKKGKLAVFAVFAMLSITTAKIKEPQMLNVRNGLEFFSFEPGIVRSYAFLLTDFAERQRECGPSPVSLFIQGKNLQGLDVTVSGATVRSREIRRLYAINYLAAKLEDVDPAGIEVRLRSNGLTTPAIVLGPELDTVDGFDIYPDAVYILFENASCRVIYHAKPRDLKTSS